MRSLLCGWCALMFLSVNSIADVISLVPVADTTISEGGTAHTHAGADTMIVGRLSPNGNGSRARALMRFDLSAIPTGAVITSATLIVSVSNNHMPEEFHTLAIHRLNMDWEEFEAVWENTGGIPWDGGDFAQPADSTLAMQGLGSFTFPSTPQMIATVQMWSTNAASNYGFVLLNQDEETLGNARRVLSRENQNGQPTLTINYTTSVPPPADFTVTSPGVFAINGEDGNPTLTLTRGATYIFEINTAEFHPFEIASNPQGADYSDGLSTNSIFNGRIVFTVPQDAPDRLYYICPIHFFGGEINIVNPPLPPLFQIISLGFSNNSVVLKTTGTNGWLVVPEYSSNLVSSNWAVVPSFNNSFLDGTNVTVFDRLDPICGPNVFLRVRNTKN